MAVLLVSGAGVQLSIVPFPFIKSLGFTRGIYYCHGEPVEPFHYLKEVTTTALRMTQGEYDRI